MIVYDVATKILDTKSFPQHNIAGLTSGITYTVLFSQEKPSRWRKYTHTQTHTHTHPPTHTHTHTHTHTLVSNVSNNNKKRRFLFKMEKGHGGYNQSFQGS